MEGTLYIPVLERWRQGDQESEDTLGYLIQDTDPVSKAPEVELASKMPKFQPQHPCEENVGAAAYRAPLLEAGSSGDRNWRVLRAWQPSLTVSEILLQKDKGATEGDIGGWILFSTCIPQETHCWRAWTCTNIHQREEEKYCTEQKLGVLSVPATKHSGAS